MWDASGVSPLAEPTMTDVSMSEPATGENVSSLLPSPAASQGGYNRSDSDGAAVRPQLPMLVRRLLPSPTAADAKNRRTSAWAKETRNSGPSLTDVLVGPPVTVPAREPDGTRRRRSERQREPRSLSAREGIRRELGRLGPGTWWTWYDAERDIDYGPAIRRHELAFGREAPWPVVEGTRSLSGNFTEWMMMLPAGWVDGVSNTAQKRLCGNAVVTRQAALALRVLLGETLVEAMQ